MAELPRDAMPESTTHGEKNYTVTFGGIAKIQVLLYTRAYYVKMVKEGIALDASRTVSWNAHGGPADAWRVAKQIALGGT